MRSATHGVGRFLKWRGGRPRYHAAHLLYGGESGLYCDARSIFDALDRGEFTVVTSYITLLEVLVHPLKQGNADPAEQYRTILLNSPHVQSLPVSADIAEEAAQLRATHNVRTSDAIQMATARHAGATHFVTNDIKLPDLLGMPLLVLDRLRANETNQQSV